MWKQVGQVNVATSWNRKLQKHHQAKICLYSPWVTTACLAQKAVGKNFTWVPNATAYTIRKVGTVACTVPEVMDPGGGRLADRATGWA